MDHPPEAQKETMSCASGLWCAATYRLKDAQPSGTGWWGQGYIDSLTPRGEDVLLHGEWLSQDDDHHCGLP